MGQQTSRKSNGIYFHHKIPSFLFIKKQDATHKPEEPIKFQYKLTKKSNERHKNKANNFDSFGFNTITNLKNVLDGVKSDCSGLKKCAVPESKHDNVSAAYKLRTVEQSTDSGQILGKISQSDVKKPKRRPKDTKKDIRTKHLPIRTKSEPNLRSERGKDRNRYKRNCGNTGHRVEKVQQFGYEIQDVDEFLAKATLNKPANIPVVLAFPSVLYQTRIGGYQAEISLPLGMVVNAIFRNQSWLYVQTPHAEEGYISYSACLPLGIIPPPDDDKSSPCWEKSTDIFPKPSGNMTDTEKLSCKSETEDDIYCPRAKYRTALSTCGEKSVDRLYLRAAAIAKGKGTRHTLLVINEDYTTVGKDSLPVLKNEVVFLLSARIKGWFFVRNKEGREGFIPSVIAGHGFL